MNKYEGGSFENFLKEEGILEEVTERALKRLLVLEIKDIVNLEKVRRQNTKLQESQESQELQYLV